MANGNDILVVICEECGQTEIVTGALNIIKTHGRVVSCRFYYRENALPVSKDIRDHLTGLETTMLCIEPRYQKEEISLDLLDCLNERELQFDTVCIVSGHEDFTPILKKLHKRNIRVIGVKQQRNNSAYEKALDLLISISEYNPKTLVQKAVHNLSKQPSDHIISAAKSLMPDRGTIKNCDKDIPVKTELKNNQEAENHRNSRQKKLKMPTDEEIRKLIKEHANTDGWTNKYVCQDYLFKTYRIGVKRLGFKTYDEFLMHYGNYAFRGNRWVRSTKKLVGIIHY